MEYETRLQEKISHNNHYYLCNKNNYYNMYYYVLYYLSLLHMLELVLSGGILEKWWWYHYFFYSHLILCIICNGIKSEIRIEFIFYVWPKELAELEKVNNYFSNIGIFIFGEKRIKKLIMILHISDVPVSALVVLLTLSNVNVDHHYHNSLIP